MPTPLSMILRAKTGSAYLSVQFSFMLSLFCYDLNDSQGELRV